MRTEKQLRAWRKIEAKRRPEQQRDEWRHLPATPEQLKVLRRSAMKSGRAFDPTLTRGSAWARIRRSSSVPEALRMACAPPWATRARR